MKKLLLLLSIPLTLFGCSKDRNLDGQFTISDLNLAFKNMELPFKNHWFKHGTTFILPKLSDYLKSKNRNYAKTYIKYLFGKAIS